MESIVKDTEKGGMIEERGIKDCGNDSRDKSNRPYLWEGGEKL